MSPANKFRIPSEKLRRICDCEQELSFCLTSRDVPELDGVIGQERAVRSMKFGLEMDAPGYNIFVVGPVGTGKNTYVQSIVTHTGA
ncbi:MAG: AAA family ATPase, partial [Ruminococcaceae bacterium]|nr:AAA family ATPase [Oscillospiraceae bacterium]